MLWSAGIPHSLAKCCLVNAWYCGVECQKNEVSIMVYTLLSNHNYKNYKHRGISCAAPSYVDINITRTVIGHFTLASIPVMVLATVIMQLHCLSRVKLLYIINHPACVCTSIRHAIFKVAINGSLHASAWTCQSVYFMDASYLGQWISHM